MVQTPSKSDTRTPEQCYQEMCERVATFTDTLGMPVDPGIFETVVVFNLLGLHTFQSCEGHLDHGCPYPWVTIIDEEQERLFNRRWLAVCQLEDQAKEAGTQEAYDRYLAADVQLRLVMARSEMESSFYKRLTSLLDAFYLHSVTPDPSRLVVRRFKSSSRYRIEPGFVEALESIPETLKGHYLARGQAEMQAFTISLKRQWHLQRIEVTDERENVSR